MLALDEQQPVRWWHECIVEFVGVVTCLVWKTLYDTTIVIAHPYMLFKYITMATTNDSGLILISMEYMEPYCTHTCMLLKF